MLEKISELKENYHIRLLDEWFIIQDLLLFHRKIRLPNRIK